MSSSYANFSSPFQRFSLDDSMFLRFTRGKPGQVIAREPSSIEAGPGKICLPDKDSEETPQFNEMWRCITKFEKPNFKVVTPLTKGEAHCYCISFEPGEGLNILPLSIPGKNRDEVLIGSEAFEFFQFPVPIEGTDFTKPNPVLVEQEEGYVFHISVEHKIPGFLSPFSFTISFPLTPTGRRVHLLWHGQSEEIVNYIYERWTRWASLFKKAFPSPLHGEVGDNSFQCDKCGQILIRPHRDHEIKCSCGEHLTFKLVQKNPMYTGMWESKRGKQKGMEDEDWICPPKFCALIEKRGKATPLGPKRLMSSFNKHHPNYEVMLNLEETFKDRIDIFDSLRFVEYADILYRHFMGTFIKEQ